MNDYKTVMKAASLIDMIEGKIIVNDGAPESELYDDLIDYINRKNESLGITGHKWTAVSYDDGHTCIDCRCHESFPTWKDFVNHIDWGE